jgi:excisionase family DNA binding protein
MSNHLLKGNDVAERLNISRSQAFAMMRNGNIPTVRFGERCVRVRPEDLEAFISLNVTRREIQHLVPTNPSRISRGDTL